MCCFRLHFSDFNVYFFKKIKNLLRFTFERNNLLCLKREKNNLSRGKIPAPPGYQMVRPLGQTYKKLFSPNLSGTITCRPALGLDSIKPVKFLSPAPMSTA